MITRLWRGWTTPENADEYERIVSTEVLPGIAARNVPGYHGAYLLRRDLGDEVEFATLMLFDSLDAVRAFGGDAVTQQPGSGPICCIKGTKLPHFQPKSGDGSSSPTRGRRRHSSRHRSVERRGDAVRG
jgi:hypothetical protein